MFGFTLLGNVLPFKSIDDFFNDEFFKDQVGFKKAKSLEDAVLLDTHQYNVGDLTYEQKVYRLANNSIFVDTKTVRDEEIMTLKAQLKKALAEERYEDAAKLRDQIKEK